MKEKGQRVRPKNRPQYPKSGNGLGPLGFKIGIHRKGDLAEHYKDLTKPARQKAKNLVPRKRPNFSWFKDLEDIDPANGIIDKRAVVYNNRMNIYLTAGDTEGQKKIAQALETGTTLKALKPKTDDLFSWILNVGTWNAAYKPEATPTGYFGIELT